MEPEKVVSAVWVLVRLKLPSVTEPAPERLPIASLPARARVAPAATDTLLLEEIASPPLAVRVPALMVVAPEKVLAAPERVRLPAPALVTAPLPEMRLAMVAVSPAPWVKVCVAPPPRVMVPPVRTRPLA